MLKKLLIIIILTITTITQPINIAKTITTIIEQPTLFAEKKEAIQHWLQHHTSKKDKVVIQQLYNTILEHEKLIKSQLNKTKLSQYGSGGLALLSLSSYFWIREILERITESKFYEKFNISLEHIEFYQKKFTQHYIPVGIVSIIMTLIYANKAGSHKNSTQGLQQSLKNLQELKKLLSEYLPN